MGRGRSVYGMEMLACALGLAALAGCGESGGLLAGSVITAATDLADAGRPPKQPLPWDPPRNFGAEAVEIRATRLVGTAGGCEIEVTYRNTTDRPLDIGFTYRVLDGQGRELRRLSTPVQGTPPGASRVLTSGTTTDGPSGIPCVQIARAELVSVSAWDF